MAGSFVLPKRKRAGDEGDLRGAKEHKWRASDGADRFDMSVTWWQSSPTKNTGVNVCASMCASSY